MFNMKFDIISIGSAVKDTFIISDEFEIIRSNKFEGGYGECVSLGAKIDIDEIHFSTGGGGTNSASTFAKLGFLTGIITKIGEDDNGQSIISELQKLSVNTDLVRKQKNGITGYSTLLTTRQGERSILVYRGVSSDFSSADIPTNKIATKWLYLTSLAGSKSALTKIFRHVKKQKIKLVWNPGKAELKMKPSLIHSWIGLTHVFMVNKEEAQLLLGTPKSTTSAMLYSLKQHPDQVIIITDGANGTHAIKGKNIYHCGTRDIKSISRAGAGDAFGSGCTASLMKGDDIQTALRVGTFNAESVIQSFGAKQGQITKFPSKVQLAKIKITKLI
jgi:ribokinase